MNQNKKEISTAAAAERIGCCRSTVLALIHRGEIDAYAFSSPGWFHVDLESVLSYIARIRGNGGNGRKNGRAGKRAKGGKR